MRSLWRPAVDMRSAWPERRADRPARPGLARASLVARRRAEVGPLRQELTRRANGALAGVLLWLLGSLCAWIVYLSGAMAPKVLHCTYHLYWLWFGLAMTVALVVAARMGVWCVGPGSGWWRGPLAFVMGSFGPVALAASPTKPWLLQGELGPVLAVLLMSTAAGASLLVPAPLAAADGRPRPSSPAGRQLHRDASSDAAGA